METYDTFMNIMGFIPLDRRTLIDISLVSKRHYNTIMEDEYGIIWKMYMNNIPRVHIPYNVHWLRIADLFKIEIQFRSRTLSHVRTKYNRNRFSALIFESYKIDTKRLEQRSLRISKNDIRDTIIRLNNHVLFENRLHKDDIITIITDIEHGVIYFFLNNILERFNIKRSNEGYKINIVVYDNAMEYTTMLPSIIMEHGEEIFTCNMQPYDMLPNIDDIIEEGNIDELEHLIKYNVIKVNDIINKDRIYRFVYSNSRIAIECIMTYCNLRQLQYIFEHVMKNINNEVDLVWLLDNVIDPNNLYMDSNDEDYLEKLVTYNDILNIYGIYYRPIVHNKIYNEKYIHDLPKDVIKLRFGMIEEGNTLIPLIYSNIMNIISTTIPYEYRRGIFSYTNVTIEDGLDLRHSLSHNRVIMPNRVHLKHNGMGEYNIILDNVIYYTRDIVDVAYCLCNEHIVPIMEDQESLFLRQCSRGTLSESGRQTKHIILEINRSIYLGINNVEDILYKMHDIDTYLEPCVRHDDEYIADCFYLTPNVTTLNLNSQKIRTLDTLVYMTKLQRLILDHSNITELPGSLMELDKILKHELYVQIRGIKLTTVPNFQNILLSL